MGCSNSTASSGKQPKAPSLPSSPERTQVGSTENGPGNETTSDNVPGPVAVERPTDSEESSPAKADSRNDSHCTGTSQLETSSNEPGNPGITSQMDNDGGPAHELGTAARLPSENQPVEIKEDTGIECDTTELAELSSPAVKPAPEMKTPGHENRDNSPDDELDGCYLLYDPKDNGTFLMKFSKSLLPSALAVVKKGDLVDIPPFKYKRSEQLCSKINEGTANFLQGLCLFIKEGRLLKGEFSFLPTLRELVETDPKVYTPFRMFLLNGTALREAKVSEPGSRHKLRFTEAVACLPATCSVLDGYLSPGAEIKKAELAAQLKKASSYGFLQFK